MNLKFVREEEPFVFRVTSETGASTLIDANPKIGGKNKGLRPMQLVASGLAGCISIDVLLILKKQRTPTSKYEIDIVANEREDIPKRFVSIDLNFKVDDSIDRTKLAKSIQLVIDKYCPVAASLKDEIEINYSITGI